MKTVEEEKEEEEEEEEGEEGEGEVEGEGVQTLSTFPKRMSNLKKVKISSWSILILSFFSLFWNGGYFETKTCSR